MCWKQGVSCESERMCTKLYLYVNLAQFRLPKRFSFSIIIFSYMTCYHHTIVNFLVLPLSLSPKAHHQIHFKWHRTKKNIFGKNAIAIENHFIHVAHKLGVGNCLGIKYSVILEEFVNCPFLVYISTCVAYKSDNTHNHNHHQGSDGSPLSRLLFHAMCFLYISEVEFSEMSSYVSIYLFSHMHTSFQSRGIDIYIKWTPLLCRFIFSFVPKLLHCF